MFDEEKEDLDKLYKYFEDKFGEEVGIMAAVVETEEFEMDLIVGMDSDLVRGIRLLQFFPSEDEDAATPDDVGSGGEGEEGDEDEEEEDLYDVMVYDFVATDAKPPVEGETFFEVKIADRGCCDDDEDDETAPVEDDAEPESFWVAIKVLMKEDDEGAELTGIELTYVDSGEVVVFKEAAF